MISGILASTTFRWGLFWLVIVLAVLTQSTVLPAQETKTLPPAESVPLDSGVDVSTLPPPPPSPPRETRPPEVKPSHITDPEALREWKDLLQRVPGSLPTAPGFIEDTGPQKTNK